MTGAPKYQGRVCRKCGGTERYVAKGNRCVACLAIYQATPGGKARREKYRKTPKGKEYSRNKTARYYKTARGKFTRKRFYHSLSNQNTLALKKYGIPLSEIVKRREQQGNLCAICGIAKRLVVDHDHSTGKVRGLLCGSCNRGIGYLKDSPEIIRAGAAYIESHSQEKANGASA